MPCGTLELEADLGAGAAGRVLRDAGVGKGGKIALGPETVEQDLARLVLALLEFLRQLMELQAIRRMEAGHLSEAEEERVGLTLMRAAAKIREMATSFGLDPDDLKLDLGPLGSLT